MKMEIFQMERAMSKWENEVEYDISESGGKPVTFSELIDLGLDLDSVMEMSLGNCQGNGTLELREALAKLYPGASPDHIEVTNGTSEANYLLAITLLRDSDSCAVAVPNYMQLPGIARAVGAEVETFRLRQGTGWDVDWDEFEKAVTPNTRVVYISRPSNPTGSVLPEESVRRIVERCEEMDSFLIADEVYIGMEIDGSRTKTCWGMSDKVISTGGLSKAYGIPGIRIGWLVGPPDVVAECWAQHDYITVTPNKLSDLMARTAVDLENREKLFRRIQERIQGNLSVYREWVDQFDGFLEFAEPTAGAFCFIKYNADVSSQDIADSLRVNQSTLVAPGSHFGMDRYLRLWAGGDRDFIAEGLERVSAELNKVR